MAPDIFETAFRLIAFDWDGTAVTSRADRPTELADAMEQLLMAGVALVVITGTNANNVSGQIAPLLSVEARSRLYLMVNRGSEVYAYDASGELELLYRREPTPEENTALDRTAEAVQAQLRDAYGVEVGIVSNRLNRRKIDLIPEPAWADPPKSQIGELLAAVEERLEPVPGGIGAAIDLAGRLAHENGLPDARITSDVKHIEVGLTDKSDSIAFLMQRLAPARAIRPHEVLIGGDEFGPIAGFEGSDYRMVTRLATGATLFSVGKEPNGTPTGVLNLGGGPAHFVQLLREQAAHARSGLMIEPPPRRPAEDPEGDQGWTIIGEGYDLTAEASEETLFSLVNRYMGVRGSTDELNPSRTPRAFVAGLFDGELPGVEDLVVTPDWVAIELHIDGRPFTPWSWNVRTHRRTLDLRALRLDRELIVEDPDGRVFALRTSRVLSLANPHLGAVRLSLELVSGEPARVSVRAGIWARTKSGDLPHVEVTAAGDADGVDMLHTRTPGARVAVDVGQALAARIGHTPIEAAHVTDEHFSGREFDTELTRHAPLEIDRHVAVFTEREEPESGSKAADTARRSLAAGWDALIEAHALAWASAWARSDVEIDEPAAQIGIRFAVAQLIAVAPQTGSRTSVAAKGLTGEGYKGHVFWDTDVFLMQFYAYTMPEVAREIIEYRIGTLPAARRNAENAGLEGAWFAWESAASGEDVTPDFVVGPGGRRMEVKTGKQEIHVVSDIVLAIEMYVHATGDEQILTQGAADLIVEAARFYATRGVETDRGYEIHDVIGPDELHEDVNNSAYTNYLGAWTMRRAAELVDSGVTEARPGEPARWRDLADRMVVLRTADGLIEQHEGFLSLPIAGEDPVGRAELAWQRDRMEWRDVKQADVVMLMALLEREFSFEQRLGNYRLYEPLTRHLSSLSEAVHSLVARRVRLDDAADDYFTRAVAIDLYDSRGNRPEGLHMATQGGLWQAVVLGCAGLSVSDAVLVLDPRLAPGWTRLRFSLTHHGVPGTVTLTHTSATVEANGGSIAVEIGGTRATATEHHPVQLVRDGDAWRPRA